MGRQLHIQTAVHLPLWVLSCNALLWSLLPERVAKKVVKVPSPPQTLKLAPRQGLPTRQQPPRQPAHSACLCCAQTSSIGVPLPACQTPQLHLASVLAVAPAWRAHTHSQAPGAATLVMSEPVRSFFVTLRRSHIGKPWFHRRVLESLGLKRRLQCVERPNNASTRGRLMQVAHLINIETDRMYSNRKLQELQALQLRSPLVVMHEGSKPLASHAAAEEGGGGSAYTTSSANSNSATSSSTTSSS